MSGLPFLKIRCPEPKSYKFRTLSKGFSNDILSFPFVHALTKAERLLLYYAFKLSFFDAVIEGSP